MVNHMERMKLVGKIEAFTLSLRVVSDDVESFEEIQKMRLEAATELYEMSSKSPGESRRDIVILLEKVKNREF